jgi:hypothetical protein
MAIAITRPGNAMPTGLAVGDGSAVLTRSDLHRH